MTNPTEKIIAKAAELAYEEDSYMIVGIDELDDWVVRHPEDPKHESLKNRHRVDSCGVCNSID